MRFAYTRHATKKMTELGVSRTEVEGAILRGMKFGPDSRGLMHARMGGLEVVYDRVGDLSRVVTVFPTAGGL